MAVRSAPFYRGDGPFAVFGDGGSKHYASLDYTLFEVANRASDGREFDYRSSVDLAAYVDLTKGMEAKPTCRSTSGFISYGPICEAKESGPIASALFRARRKRAGQPESHVQRVALAVFEAVSGPSFSCDALACAGILSLDSGDMFTSSSELTAIRDAAATTGYTHAPVHGELGASLAARILEVGSVTPTTLRLQSRIKLLSRLLEICSAPPQRGSMQGRKGGASSSLSLSTSRRLAAAISRVPTAVLLDGVDFTGDRTFPISDGTPLYDSYGFLHSAIATGRFAGPAVVGVINETLGVVCADEGPADELSISLEKFAASKAYSSLLEEVEACEKSAQGLRVARMGSLGTWFAHERGGFLVGRNHTFVLSRADLQHCIEISKEAFMAYIVSRDTWGEGSAEEFYEGWLSYHRQVASMSHNDAALAACAQRDIDLVLKNYAAGDVYLLDGGLMAALNEAGGDFGPAGAPALDLARRLVESGTTPELIYCRYRLFRSIVMTWFDAVYFISQTMKCYHLGATVSQEYAERFSEALRQVLASAHRAITGRWPSGVEELLSQCTAEVAERADQMNVVPLEITRAWVSFGDGAALWDSSAVRVRDKTNVPPEMRDLLEPEELADVPLERKREILVYAGKDAATEAGRYIGAVDPSKPYCGVTMVTAKPEQKPGSRVVAMEEQSRRKGNSVLSNNVIQLADTLAGSLMGASARKLAGIETKNTSMLAENKASAVRQRVVTIFMCLDFVKFGHFIALDLQRANNAELDRYFGLDWAEEHIRRNEDLDIMLDPAGLVARFRNIEGADGQGLRNGPWQLMLGALARLVFAEMRSVIPEIIDEEQIWLSYFMDDHNFPVKVTMPQHVVNEQLMSEFVRDIGRRLQRVSAEVYNNCGLNVNGSKSVISISGYTQTGDVYGLNGRLCTPGKGIVSALCRPEHVAPGLLDNVGSAISGCAGALANHADIRSVYACGVWAAHWQSCNSGVRYDYGVAVNLGFLMAVPVRLTGLGFPTVANLCVDRGVHSHDDSIIALYRHAMQDGPLAKLAQNILTQDLQRDSVASMCSCPFLRRARTSPDLKNPIDELLLSSTFASDWYKVRSLQEERLAGASAIVSSHTILPATVVAAYWANHPASVAEGDVLRIAGSSTVKRLLPREQIDDARVRNRRNAFGYSAFARRLEAGWRLPLRGLTEILARLTANTVECLISGPPRLCLVDFVEPATDPEDDNLLMTTLSKRTWRNGTRQLTASAGSTSTVNTKAAWPTPEMAALVACIDTGYAMGQIGENAVGCRAYTAPWTGEDLRHLCVVEADAFVDLNAVAFVPPVHSEALSSTAQVCSLSFGRIADHARSLPAGHHTSYYMVEAAALLRIALGEPRPPALAVAEGAFWFEPMMRSTGQVAQFTTSANPRSAQAVERLKQAAARSRIIALPLPYARTTPIESVLSAINQLSVIAREQSEEKRESAPELEGFPDAPRVESVESLTNEYRARAIGRSDRDRLRQIVRMTCDIVARLSLDRVSKRGMRATLLLSDAAQSFDKALEVAGRAGKDDWYSAAIPAPEQLSIMSQSLIAVDALAEVVLHYRRFALGGRAAMQSVPCTTLYESIEAAKRYAPHRWCRSLLASARVVPSIEVNTMNPDLLKPYYRDWATRYLGHYQSNARAVSELKAQMGDSWSLMREGRLVPTPDAAKVLIATASYGALAYAYSKLARSSWRVGETPISLFTESAVRSLARIAHKYGVFDFNSLRDACFTLSRDGKHLAAFRLASATAEVQARVDEVCRDSGVPRAPIIEDLAPAIGDYTVIEETHLPLEAAPPASQRLLSFRVAHGLLSAAASGSLRRDPEIGFARVEPQPPSRRQRSKRFPPGPALGQWSAPPSEPVRPVLRATAPEYRPPIDRNPYGVLGSGSGSDDEPAVADERDRTPSPRPPREQPIPRELVPPAQAPSAPPRERRPRPIRHEIGSVDFGVHEAADAPRAAALAPKPEPVLSPPQPPPPPTRPKRGAALRPPAPVDKLDPSELE